MRYLSVCSGIEAATVAWHPLGWTPAAFSEIEAFPRAVLQHHYPDVPLHGDFTTIGADEYGPIDLLVGGTPCQSFSIAGLRGGLADDRGNLALEFLRLADRTRPRWLVWENVPGVLSSGNGRDFGSILGGLVELGYGFAYRVLDAQHFGVPQRRRRVFVVGHLGDWRRAAAVLFERHSLSRNIAPSRQAREDTSGSTGDGIARCVTAGEARRQDWETCNIIASLELSNHGSGGNVGWHAPDKPTKTLDTNCPPGVAIAFTAKDHGADAMEDCSPTLRAGGFSGSHANGGVMPAVAFSIMPMNSGRDYKARETDVAQPIMAGGPVGGNQGGDFVKQASAVRRLTPRECERLQGFPDDYTNIPWRGKAECPDGPRYKALGNSMAVPVMRWIGERIDQVEALSSVRIAA